MLIVLDGPEGAGKSTQIRLLVEQLEKQGKPTLAVRDPGATAIGEKIREILLDPKNVEMSVQAEMLLYMAARAQMMQEHILPALNAGKIVVCDRFVSSTLAYQGGPDGIAPEQIREVARIAIQDRWPSLTILLDILPGMGLERVKRAKDRIEQKSLEYHEGVRRRFHEQAKQDPARVKVVNAGGSIEKVREEIWGTVAVLLR